jgi:hypothetical protein
MIPLILDESLVKLGDNSFINWIPAIAPQVVIFGGTGSGKTYFCKLLLGRIPLYVHDAQVTVCDFKGGNDFNFLDGCKRFFRYDECSVGLQSFYERFQARQNGKDNTRNMQILYFDEWAAYLNSMEDKKQSDAEKRKLAVLLMLGRSFSCHVIISQQRVDAQYFSTARDNFGIAIGLGNISQESKEMFFSAYRKHIRPDRKRGTGYMLTNGTNLQAVQVPTAGNMDRLHAMIKEGVTR